MLLELSIYAVNVIVDAHGDRQLKVNALRLRDGQPPPGKSLPLAVQASVTNAAGQQIRLDQVQKQRAALLLVPLDRAPAPGAHKVLYVATTGDESPPSRPDAALGLHGWIVAFDVDDGAERRLGVHAEQLRRRNLAVFAGPCR